MDVLLQCMAFSIGVNLIMFLLAFILQTDKITDISYSLTFMAIAGYCLYQSDKSTIDLLYCVFVFVWGFRLGGYLMYRIHRIGRDKRFDQIRIKFTSFLFFWLMQGLTCFIVMIPVILLSQVAQKEAGILMSIGLLIALFGFIIETIADQQKFRFKLKYPDKFMSKGLWGQLQHPSYAGELLFWWGIFISSLNFIDQWYSVIAPLWFSLIIIKFSGIRILQKRWKEQYGGDPEFQQYHKTTRKLIPYLY